MSARRLLSFVGGLINGLICLGRWRPRRRVKNRSLWGARRGVCQSSRWFREVTGFV
nr:MAG TPA: hypothetical protein [Caudoviricetes sp.]